MSGRSIPLFRHFKPQNLSTGYAFIHSSEIFFQFYFWPLRRYCRYSELILFCREDQYSSLYTLNLKIHPLFQILQAFLDGSQKWGGEVRSRRSNRRNLIHIEEDNNILSVTISQGHYLPFLLTHMKGYRAFCALLAKYQDIHTYAQSILALHICIHNFHTTGLFFLKIYAQHNTYYHPTCTPNPPHPHSIGSIPPSIETLWPLTFPDYTIFDSLLLIKLYTFY